MHFLQLHFWLRLSSVLDRFLLLLGFLGLAMNSLILLHDVCEIGLVYLFLGGGGAGLSPLIRSILIIAILILLFGLLLYYMCVRSILLFHPLCNHTFVSEILLLIIIVIMHLLLMTLLYFIRSLNLWRHQTLFIISLHL